MIVHPLPGREQTGEALYHREAVDALCSWLSVLQSNMENLPHDRSRWFASDSLSADLCVCGPQDDETSDSAVLKVSCLSRRKRSQAKG